MKAKRFLSAFLAVVMLLSLSTVAFAVNITPDNLADGPAGGKINVKVEFIKIEDPTADATLGPEIEAGAVVVPEGTTLYWAKLSASDYGTLTSKTTGAGLKMQNFNVRMGFYGEDSANYIDMSEDGKNLWAYDIGDTGLLVAGHDLYVDGFNMQFTGLNGKGCWPSGNVTAQSDEAIMGMIPIAIKNSALPFTCSLTSFVEITNYTANTAVNGQYTYGTDLDSVVLVNGATYTFGGSGNTDPTESDIEALVPGDTDGVAIKGSDKKYDNAYATTAKFNNAGTVTGAGVLFIPALVLGENELTREVDAADAYKAGAAIVEGGITIKAAIRGIPREYNGLTMVSRPYMIVNDAPIYGAQATTVINFGNTGEVE